MAYNKVVLNGKTLIDLTEDTVNKKVLGADYTAHNAAGDTITGNLVLSPENISSNISIDLLPPEDTTRAWIPIGQEYDTLRQQAIPHRTMTVTLPTINGTDNPSLTSYAPAHPDDINQCLGYGIIRKYESNYAKLGIVQINQDGTTKVLLNDYNMFSSSNSYIGSIEGVVDTPDYIYILTGYDSSTSSYRDYNYLWYFNKNTNTITRISNYILTKQYSQSFSLYTLGNAVYVFGRHNASSSSSTHSSWYYKIFKTIIGSSTVSTIYSLNRYVTPSIFIYKDLFYTTLADDSNNTSQYAIFDGNGTIVDHWQTGNGITGVPQVIYNDWFIYLTYKYVYDENGMGSSSSYIYYYYGCNYNTREVKWVASGLNGFNTSNVTILNNEIVGRSSKTFCFYPLIPEQFNENVLTLVPRNNIPLITYNENTQQFVKGANIYDAYFISTTGEVKTCGVYCYTNNLWSPLNAVTHTPVARFKMNNQLEYCDNDIIWGDYINTKYNVNGYILDEDSGYIKLNDNIICEKTAVGCQSVASTEQIKPEGEYVTYQGNLDTYTIDLRLSNVTTASSIKAISRADTLTLTFTADSNYKLPTSVTVNNANYTWDAETGVLQIGSPFANVEVIITAETI